MESVEEMSEPPGQRWAFRHPFRAGLLVFVALFGPLGLQGVLTGDSAEILLGLSGAVILGGGWFALHRWGAAHGLGQVTDHSASDPASRLPTDRERNWAQACQLCILFVPVIGAAAVRVQFKNDQFVRAFAVEALNLQLALVAVIAAMVTAGFATGFEGAAFSVVYVFGVASYLYCLGVSLMGTMKAANGERWSYPVNLRVFR